MLDRIACPLCGSVVEQVASATLDLALWQHMNWVCPKKDPLFADMVQALQAAHDHLLMNNRTATRSFRLVAAVLDKLEGRGKP